MCPRYGSEREEIISTRGNHGIKLHCQSCSGRTSKDKLPLNTQQGGNDCDLVQVLKLITFCYSVDYSVRN